MQQISLPELDGPLLHAVQSVVDLYQIHSELRFPDVDAEGLQAAYDALCREAERVQTLAADLECARNELQKVRTTMLQKARLGLGYARVYGETAPEVGERVAPIEWPDEGSPAPKKRRRRRSAPKLVAVAEADEPLPLRTAAATP